MAPHFRLDVVAKGVAIHSVHSIQGLPVGPTRDAPWSRFSPPMIGVTGAARERSIAKGAAHRGSRVGASASKGIVGMPCAPGSETSLHTHGACKTRDHRLVSPARRTPCSRIRTSKLPTQRGPLDHRQLGRLPVHSMLLDLRRIGRLEDQRRMDRLLDRWRSLKVNQLMSLSQSRMRRARAGPSIPSSRPADQILRPPTPGLRRKGGSVSMRQKHPRRRDACISGFRSCH